MNKIGDYIELAKKRSGAKSERKLCDLLNVSPTTITSYRKGVVPNDETMLKLATLAGIDHETALLELNFWRSPAPAQKAYANILQKINRGALAALMLTAVFLPSSSDFAGEICQLKAMIVNIMENKG